MITYAALAPHPPLLIPDIGGSRLKEVSPTVEGMKQLAQEVAKSSPECLVFFHSPRQRLRRLPFGFG